MKKFISLIMLLTLGHLAISQNNKSESKKFRGLKTLDDSVSYFIGNDIAKNFVNNNIHRVFHITAFNEGLEDGFQEGELLFSKEIGNKMIMDKLSNIRSDSSEFDFKEGKVKKFKALTNFKDSVSYFLGSDIAGGLKSNGFETHFQFASFYKGLNDGFLEKEPLLNVKAGEKVAMQVMEMEKGRLEAEKKLKFKNKLEEGESFLEDISKRSDVVTLPSGLRYKIITEGTGEKPTSNDKVKTHYHGYFINGKVFDSSVDRGEPSEFPVTAVIKGWTEALQLMPVGSKWTLYIPYQLAYGEKGMNSISPYEVLIFDVELIEIIKPKSRVE